MAEDRVGRRQELLLHLLREGHSPASAMQTAHKLSAFVEEDRLAGATADAILVFCDGDQMVGTAERVSETAKELDVLNMRLLFRKLPHYRRHDLREVPLTVVSYLGGRATTWDGVVFGSGEVERQGGIVWIKDALFSIPPEATRTETEA